MLLLTILAYVLSLPFSNKGAGLANDPGMYPQTICLILGILATIMLVMSIIAYKANGRDADEHKTAEKAPLSATLNKPFFKMLTILALFVAYLFMLKYLGYLIATILFLFPTLVFLARGEGKKKTGTSIIISIVCSVILYLIFQVALKVPLPKGIFF